MPAIDVELIVFSMENGAINILLEPDAARAGYRRLPWRGWEGKEDFVQCVRQLADEVAPGRQMEPVFSDFFSMSHPRRGLAMTFFLCASPPGLAVGPRGAHLASFAQPSDVSHVYLTILAKAFERLRETLNEAPLVPRMLDAGFTLTQVQDATELVVGATVDKRHFRKQLQESDWLEETGEMSGGAHRPAKLYRLAQKHTATRKVA